MTRRTLLEGKRKREGGFPLSPARSERACHPERRRREGPAFPQMRRTCPIAQRGAGSSIIWAAPPVAKAGTTKGKCYLSSELFIRRRPRSSRSLPLGRLRRQVLKRRVASERPMRVDRLPCTTTVLIHRR